MLFGSRLDRLACNEVRCDFFFQIEEWRKYFQPLYAVKNFWESLWEEWYGVSTSQGGECAPTQLSLFSFLYHRLFLCLYHNYGDPVKISKSCMLVPLRPVLTHHSNKRSAVENRFQRRKIRFQRRKIRFPRRKIRFPRRKTWNMWSRGCSLGATSNSSQFSR